MCESLSIPLFDRARKHGDRAALIATEGVFTYEDLMRASADVAADLLQHDKDLNEARVAFLVPPGFRYVAALWGIWRAGGLAVPLAVSHPRPELEYVVDDSEASIVAVAPEFEERLRPIAEERSLRMITVDPDRPETPRPLPNVSPGRRAMIIYTSGTTGKPKGVVTTHEQIQAQITTLVSAWGWKPDDHILHVLPLHHVHGIVNILLCALWSGAVCEIMPRFEADAVWDRMAQGDLTLFMGVPTIYSRLISAWESLPEEERHKASAGAARLRLMVSGSAALPVSILERWKEITGHVLLERYGMTEIGMALSNPLHGDRVPGYVGRPLPHVSVRVVDEKHDTPVDAGRPGELQVRGPGVFLEYWRRPEETEASFSDGWFQTGDVVVVENGLYRILGRSSVDIIKTGGYKVSALEIEETLRNHPLIAECAVVGISDEEWGQRVAAAVVLKPGEKLELADLRTWAKERLAPYKIPSKLLVTDALPRNPMGKVMKNQVVRICDE
ncbi:MAG: acyl-CoA synthetase [Deltaproteobacteria bacterium]